MSGRAAAFIVFLLGCEARVPVEDAYGPCEADADCVDEARCEAEQGFNICRPTCHDDADCPSIDGAGVACRTDDDGAAECVIGPDREGCPEGMFAVGSSPSPTAPLICVWKS
jgi:hypothetical protein